MEDRRCKLGLAGRFELVRLVEQGFTRRPPPTVGGIAGGGQARASVARSSAWPPAHRAANMARDEDRYRILSVT